MSIRFATLGFAGLLLIAATPNIPESWNDADLKSFRLPLAGLGHAPRVLSEEEYYKLPEQNLKTYPVYAPGREPAGYIDWLKGQEPRPLVDVSSLKTEADWLAAGKAVFEGRELPRFTGSEDNLKLIHDPKIVAAYGLQTTPEGVLIGLRYVVREKGKVQLGTDTCAMCHTRVLPDGQVIEGPANVHTPFGALMGDLTRRYAQIGPAFFEERRRNHMREDYRVPFLANDPNLVLVDSSPEQIAHLYEIEPLGVYPRSGTSLLYPVKIANLIGIRDMHYFDRTAPARNRDIRDLMRYSEMIADVSDALTHYTDDPNSTLNLANMGLGSGIHRTPDALLYALAKYIYSLEPPANPNPVNAHSKHGEKVFQSAGCSGCHTAPLYTNNKLTLAEGFHPSPEYTAGIDVMPLSVGTDPNLALKTRKGTGFYRVPSLRMVWLEKALLHNGDIGTLEELLDSNRLKDDFRSSNWPAAMPSHAVPGHRFGFDLNSTDKADLIAFLRTL